MRLVIYDVNHVIGVVHRGLSPAARNGLRCGSATMRFFVALVMRHIASRAELWFEKLGLRAKPSHADEPFHLGQCGLMSFLIRKL